MWQVDFANHCAIWGPLVQEERNMSVQGLQHTHKVPLVLWQTLWLCKVSCFEISPCIQVLVLMGNKELFTTSEWNLNMLMPFLLELNKSCFQTFACLKALVACAKHHLCLFKRFLLVWCGTQFHIILKLQFLSRELLSAKGTILKAQIASLLVFKQCKRWNHNYKPCSCPVLGW